MDRSIQEKNMHLEVGAQVVGPSLAALLAHPAGERLRYHRPLPVAVPHHHLPENSASERARTQQHKFSIQPRANTFCIETNQKERRKEAKSEELRSTHTSSASVQGPLCWCAL